MQKEKVDTDGKLGAQIRCPNNCSSRIIQNYEIPKSYTLYICFLFSRYYVCIMLLI